MNKEQMNKEADSKRDFYSSLTEILPLDIGQKLFLYPPD